MLPSASSLGIQHLTPRYPCSVLSFVYSFSRICLDTLRTYVRRSLLQYSSCVMCLCGLGREAGGTGAADSGRRRRRGVPCLGPVSAALLRRAPAHHPLLRAGLPSCAVPPADAQPPSAGARSPPFSACKICFYLLQSTQHLEGTCQPVPNSTIPRKFPKAHNILVPPRFPPTEYTQSGIYPILVYTQYTQFANDLISWLLGRGCSSHPPRLRDMQSIKISNLVFYLPDISCCTSLLPIHET